jgi:hypothetical protein
MMEVLDIILQWVVAPVAAFVWLLHSRSQAQATDIAVLRAMHEANKEFHDREFKELRETLKTINSKLDSIEQAMRK